MRTKYMLSIGLMGWVLFFAVQSQAYVDTFTTGKDWLEKMDEKEKVISLIPPAMFFHNAGVPMRHQPYEYINTLDQVLLENPYLEKEDVANIFASTLYAYEPESRAALDWLASESGLGQSLLRERNLPHVLLRKNSETV